jgi:hypothetical protein
MVSANTFPGSAVKGGRIVKPGKRVLSKDARWRMSEAGRENLQAHHRRVKETRSAVLAQKDAYRANIMLELGPNPTSTRIALAEAAVLTYSSILIVHNELLYRSRKDVLALTERTSWLTSNLSRLLQTLNLDVTPKPRCLADLVDPRVAPTSVIETEKPSVSSESRGKAL